MCLSSKYHVIIVSLLGGLESFVEVCHHALLQFWHYSLNELSLHCSESKNKESSGADEETETESTRDS